MLAATPTSRPVLAVDVDGVISLFGFDGPLAERRRPLPPDRRHGPLHLRRRRARSCCASAERLRAGLGDGLGGAAPTTTCRCSSACPRAAGACTFDGRARFGTAHWKLEALDEYAGDRPLAWIDDSLDESCHDWAEARPAPTLLVPDRVGHRAHRRAHRDAVGLGARGVHCDLRGRGRAEARARDRAVDGFVPIFFLMVVLKIPVGLLLYLVWWAFRAETRARGGAAGLRRSPLPPLPARAEAPARPAARRPRARRPAAARLPAGRPHPDPHPTGAGPRRRPPRPPARQRRAGPELASARGPARGRRSGPRSPRSRTRGGPGPRAPRRPTRPPTGGSSPAEPRSGTRPRRATRRARRSRSGRRARPRRGGGTRPCRRTRASARPRPRAARPATR